MQNRFYVNLVVMYNKHTSKKITKTVICLHILSIFTCKQADKFPNIKQEELERTLNICTT